MVSIGFFQSEGCRKKSKEEEGEPKRTYYMYVLKNVQAQLLDIGPVMPIYASEFY